jgi:small subunit ribosomal protein S5
MAEQKKLMARRPRDRMGTLKEREKAAEKSALETWKPKTVLGKKVKTGDIKDLKELLDQGKRILEPQIIETLLPNLESDLILVGQMRGKFGGGRRRWIKQTQKKTKEGNKPVFTSLSVVGNRNGFVGVGKGTSKETRPARDKAVRKAKLSSF